MYLFAVSKETMCSKYLTSQTSSTDATVGVSQATSTFTPRFLSPWEVCFDPFTLDPRPFVLPFLVPLEHVRNVCGGQSGFWCTQTPPTRHKRFPVLWLHVKVCCAQNAVREKRKKPPSRQLRTGLQFAPNSTAEEKTKNHYQGHQIRRRQDNKETEDLN